MRNYQNNCTLILNDNTEFNVVFLAGLFDIKHQVLTDTQKYLIKLHSRHSSDDFKSNHFPYFGNLVHRIKSSFFAIKI